MKKSLISIFMLSIFALPAFSADWSAAERVPVVGEKILKDNGLPTGTTFKVVETIADNSNISSTNTIEISADYLQYAGNDNEVAAVISHEIGYIINGKAAKDKFRNMAKAAITSSLQENSSLANAVNSEYVSAKASENDKKDADITGVDLMIKSGYNPLALVVVITKEPGSFFEILTGKPSNSERAMNLYNYLTYNYPSKVKAGYGCQEYRNFASYAEPIIEKRNANAKKLAKFNAEQKKNKELRAKKVAQYKSTGLSGWDASYIILNSLIETSE
ncbi:M48 family metalloprotease [bacterium]|nr:M48 family metalloprotease [bacterium]